MNPEQAKDIKQDFNDNHGYIYCLLFKNGKRYIGQTIKQWKQRWKRHKSNFSCCKAVHSAIKKYGYENIDFEILEYCKTKEELNERESYYISKFNTISPNGYNLKTHDTRIVYSLETRLKMSLSHRKKKKKTKNNIKKATKKEKLLFYNDEGINIFPILSQINNLSFHLNEKKYLQHFNQKQRWKNDKYKQEQSKIIKEKIRQKNAKRVFFVQMNQIFSCAGEIVEKFPEYKLSKVKIYACCLGKRNSHKNFHFKYL